MSILKSYRLQLFLLFLMLKGGVCDNEANNCHFLPAVFLCKAFLQKGVISNCFQLFSKSCHGVQRAVQVVVVRYLLITAVICWQQYIQCFLFSVYCMQFFGFPQEL